MTPSQIAHEKLQLGLWACGIGFGLFFFIGLAPLSHFIPPPSPQLSGEQLLEMYGGANLTFVKAGQRFDFFSTVTTLGTPQAITVQEIRIECFFPTDTATEAAARNLAAQRS